MRFQLTAKGDTRVPRVLVTPPLKRRRWPSLHAKVHAKITEYFSEAVQPMDEALLEVKTGHHEAQQTLEFLAVLVALRLWVDPSVDWSRRRIQLTVKGDNVCALSLTRKLKPKRRIMPKIAREVALILSSLSFPPEVDHTPGVAHALADALSRITNTNDLIAHRALAGATKAVPPVRNKQWYRALNSRPL